MTNVLYGDAYEMFGKAQGGDDTLTGGNNASIAGFVSNALYGDAYSMSYTTKGGNDVLIAGTASAGSTVNNQMYGDGGMTGLATGGADTFVFKDNGVMTVGTNNQIYDFSQSQHDHIQFSGIAGVYGFGNLTFDTKTIPGSTIIHAGT